jgi:hypothetical protein
VTRRFRASPHPHPSAGLPDCLFSDQKIQFGYILEGLGMENVGIFLSIWNILRPFGIFYCNLGSTIVIIWNIWCVVARKIWQTCPSVLMAKQSF